MRKIFPRDRVDDYAAERCDAIRPNVTAGRERYAELPVRTQLEARDPFLDRRVVGYAPGCRGSLLMKDGWRKAILRDLMTGRLPDELRYARGKHHLGWLFNRAVTAEQTDGVCSRPRLEGYAGTLRRPGHLRARGLHSATGQTTRRPALRVHFGDVAS